MKIENLDLVVISDALSFIDSDDVIFEEGIDWMLNSYVIINALSDFDITWDNNNVKHQAIVEQALKCLAA
mgnify:CR=1 FL=1